jgi:transposase
LLYRPLEKVKGITKEQYTAVITLHPKAEVIYSVIDKFKAALNSKETKYLFEWMDEVRALEIPELDSFVKGLEQDIDAVKNAVIFDCSNGLAEGSINKLKVIKRIMYGRCSFDLLRKKLIGWDRWKHIN